MFITVDASLNELGAVTFQLNEENKMKVTILAYRIHNNTHFHTGL